MKMPLHAPPTLYWIYDDSPVRGDVQGHCDQVSHANGKCDSIDRLCVTVYNKKRQALDVNTMGVPSTSRE